MEIAQTRRPRRPERVEHTDPFGRVTEMTKKGYADMSAVLSEFKERNAKITSQVEETLKKFGDEFKAKLRVFKGTSEGLGLESFEIRNYVMYEVLMITYKGVNHRVFVKEFYGTDNLEEILNTIVDGKRIEPKAEQEPYRGITGQTSNTESDDTETKGGDREDVSRPKREVPKVTNSGDADDIRAGFGRRKR